MLHSVHSLILPPIIHIPQTRGSPIDDHVGISAFIQFRKVLAFVEAEHLQTVPIGVLFHHLISPYCFI